MDTRARDDEGEEQHGPIEKITFRTIISDRPVRVVMLVVFVIMLGFGIIAPILPLYARSFGVGYDAAGLLISSFAFTRLIFDLIAGPIVDRFGERMAATSGVMFVGASSIATAFAPNFPMAVLFRGLGGAGSSVLFAALYSYLLRMVPKHRMARTLGVFFGAFNIGFIAGGPIGGLLAHQFGLASPLLFYAGLCFLSGLLYLRFMPDSPRVVAPSESSGDAAQQPLWRRTRETILKLLRTRAFVTAIVLNMAFFWMVAGGYDTLVPLFGREGLGMSTVGIGAVLAVAVATEFTVLYPAGIAADRFGRKHVLIPSLTGLAIMTAVLGLASGPVAFGVLLGLLGFMSGSAAPLPATLLSDVSPDEGSGTAVGVFRFCGDLGFVFGPLVAGVTASAFGFKGAFAVCALPVVVALVLVIRTPETLKRQA
jgi:MFS family permease